MISKKEAAKKGLTILETRAQDALLDTLKAQFPETIKEGKPSLKTIATLLGLNESANAQGYELTFTGKSLAHQLYTTPAQKCLKFRESFYPKKSAVPDSTPQNFIIKGDNLDALKALKSAYTEKVKMIYIDPPYNTKNENFIYPDNFREDYQELLRILGLLEFDEGGKEVESEALKFIQNIQSTRTHSGWLGFMLPRLKLARDLLREDGVIFISIDDNEQANLKILCDEIFGEDNFVACITWQKKKGGSQDSQDFAKEHEYILCYQKYEWKINDIKKNQDEKDFSKIINGKKAKILKLEKWGNHSLRTDRPTLYYAIKDPNGNDFYPVAPNGADGCWRKKPENLDKDHISWQESKGRLTPYEVIYFDEVLNKHKIIKTRTIFTEFGTTTDATKEIQAIFGDKIFDTPKPVNLIKHFLKLTTTPTLEGEGDIVLDFFAGSGTTAQAVMELNAEDGGNRKFILVQIDEPIKEEKSKAAYDFCKNELKSKAPVISDITIERVKRSAANPKDAFSILSLESKPTLITRKKGTLELMENDDLTPRDKALNLALHDRKPLHKAVQELFKDRLYQCEDSLYLIACDDEVLEFLRTHPSEKLYIDGYGKFNLDDFLNLNSNHNLTVIYR